MRKRALTVLLPLCVAMIMTACGGNTDTTEVGKTAVIAESTEADAQTEVEAEEQEETVESGQTESEASADEEDSEEIGNGDDGTVNGDEFPIIKQDVIDNDKSDEYGVYSTSCFDLDEFLNNKGELPGTEDVDNTDWDTYTGRWAYPKLTPCKLFDELTISKRSDKEEVLWAHGFTITISSGLYMWNWQVKDSKDPFYAELEESPKLMFTAQTVDGETDVLKYFMEYGSYSYDEEGNYNEEDEIWYRCNEYIFHIGNFAVHILCDSGEWSETGEAVELSEEDIQLIIDNIHLTDGTEH